MDQRDDPIRAYIRANRERHTPEAIRNELIAAGHDPARIDAIWLEEWPPATSPSIRQAEGQGGGLTYAAFILYILGGVVGAFGAFLLAAVAGSTGGPVNLIVFLALYAVGYLGIGYLIILLVRWLGRRFDLGVLTVVIGVVLVPIYAGLMFGTCLGAWALGTSVAGGA